MKIMCAMLVALAVCVSTVQAADLAFFNKEGKQLTMEEMAKELAKYDVIFVGELHGNQVSHRVEIELLKAMHKINPKITVSMEQFERDVQEYMDAYLDARIEEQEFKMFSRPWPNYGDYRPMVEFAKQNKLPVVAANIPRKYANLLRTSGKEAIDKLPEAEKAFIAKKLVVLDDDYKKLFVRTMEGAAKGGMPVTPAQYESFYAAQCIKDDTMAESIQEYMKKVPGNIVIHYNGEFHSRFGLGTVQKLQLLEPKLKIAVIGTAGGKWVEDMKVLGDYVYMIQ